MEKAGDKKSAGIASFFKRDAAKAKDLCIDNRVMYTVGAASRASGLLDSDVTFGIPLSVTEENIFFDR